MFTGTLADSQPRIHARILLAEDGEDNQFLIVMYLSDAGAETTIVENGRKAYEAAVSAMENGRPFDLILMDMEMPEVDGYAATGLLRQRGYKAPIIALTANTLESDRQKCLKAGCDDFLSKPVARKHFISVLAHWLGQSNTHPNICPPAISLNPPTPSFVPAENLGGPLLSDLAGDPAMADAIDRFCRGMSAKIGTIWTACFRGDHALLHQLCIQLKGAGGGYGFPAISAAADNLARLASAHASAAALETAAQDLTALCDRIHPPAKTTLITQAANHFEIVEFDSNE
jgi:CheY-like chemotaxis protein